jgi:hypothetical protein
LCGGWGHCPVRRRAGKGGRRMKPTA